MFRLERVEISGFKSFYEKVDLAFPGSVTAVVGPNGCGKSNICDAVSWALGEQSARSLRGERMDDVIFNGSAKRRPVGMAEVIVTLARRRSKGASGEADGDGNGNGHGNGNGDRIRIGRRVYREGHGEYFLNDKQVRLKDIQDELSGTGLGVRAYSVIEQGRIDQVLSTKPQDRRRLIEEAAGITRYKLKKRLAEIKLEETRGNLLRISDIIAEIEKNVVSLRRQASKAARYKEQSEALRARRAALARVRHDRLVASTAQAERLRDERRDREAEAAAALGRAESELARARLSAADADALRDRLRDAVAALEASIQRDDALLDGNRRAAADVAVRREALDREGRDVSAEQARATRELAETDERLERAVAEARVRSQAREEADHRATAAGAALAALELDLEAARADALAAAGDRVAARNARHEANLAAERLAAMLSRLSLNVSRLASELDAREAEVAAAETERLRLDADANRTRGDVAASEAEMARIAAALSEAETERDAAREALGALLHRLSALAEIAKSREGSVAETRGALEAAGVRVHGVLADRLRPAPGWEEAVDLLLADELNALLASGDAARALAAAGTLPSASLVRADWKRQTPGPAVPGALGGWEIGLENFAGLTPAERAALPPVTFVESLADALRLAEMHPSTTFVTRRRELVRGSLARVVTTPPEAAGLYALRKEIAGLASRTAGARDRLASVERSIEEHRSARRNREADLPARRERERQAASLLSAFDGRLEERRAERDRLRKEAETSSAEAATLQAEANALSAQRRELEDEEKRHAGRETATRERTDTLASQLPEARSLAMAAAEDLSHRRTEAEVAAERRRSTEAAREKLAETRTALDRRVGDALEEGRRLSARAEELANEEREARARQSANLTSRGEQAARLDGASAATLEGHARVERAEETTKAGRAVLDAARETRFEAEVSCTRVASDLEHTVASATEEFGVPPDELALPEDCSEEALASLEAEAAELAASIESMGPVNVLAYEEHRESSERLVFLTTQRDDLLKSIAELQESIRKINATSSERFLRAFTAINANFSEMFTRLFQGGAAEMRLLDENDLLESGVEIIAHPPGKRNQSILLLSGGEKALTAIALLMAIFRFKPSPFCILDEVDAPLDEANIDRFTRLLREMTDETQFIAITHNKRTMETADVMYGVTMEEPGCSKIVSVRFD
ncbi:MAG TPA: chromosome segregation protein SMC [Thermoanaerobaculia bacterium]|nr:chromosome segregation protein SMC [Thermoanaerobaculia bacterium]